MAKVMRFHVRMLAPRSESDRRLVPKSTVPPEGSRALFMQFKRFLLETDSGRQPDDLKVEGKGFHPWIVRLQRVKQTAAFAQWNRLGPDGKKLGVEATGILLSGIDKAADELVLTAARDARDSQDEPLPYLANSYESIHREQRPLLALVCHSPEARDDRLVKASAEALAQAFFDQFGSFEEVENQQR